MARSHAINTASPDAARADPVARVRIDPLGRSHDGSAGRSATTRRLLFAARNEWFGLTEADWLEAFSHHPRDRRSRRRSPRASRDARSVGEGTGRRRRRATQTCMAALAEAQRGVLRSLRIYLHRLRDGQDRRGDAGAAAVAIAQRSLRRAADRRGRTGEDHRASVELTTPPVARFRRQSVVTSQHRRGHPETDRRA